MVQMAYWSQDCTLRFVVAEHLKTLEPGKCLQITFVSLPDRHLYVQKGLQ